MELSSQAIGIIAGVIVFSFTVVATFVLLVVGGSFTRMREQAETFSAAGPAALKQALKPRPELYDELLQASRTLPRVPAPPAPAGGAGGAALGDAPAGELRGQLVTLRVLRCAEDAQRLFEACNGSTTLGHAYDPDLALWCFSPHGPFETLEELTNSSLMQPLEDGLRFTVVRGVCVLLFVPGDSWNLGRCFYPPCDFKNKQKRMPTRVNWPSPSARSRVAVGRPLSKAAIANALGDVWLNPAYRETHALHDVYYLLLGHLFGLGYRRVEMRVDVGDTDARKNVQLAGFLLEGVLRKHMIVKGCNRDTALYSMVNSAWREGAKQSLEKKIAQGDGSSKASASRKPKAPSTLKLKEPGAEQAKMDKEGEAQPVAGVENGTARDPEPPTAREAAEAELTKDKDA